MHHRMIFVKVIKHPNEQLVGECGVLTGQRLTDSRLVIKTRRRIDSYNLWIVHPDCIEEANCSVCSERFRCLTK